jgi:hypothetical protein
MRARVKQDCKQDAVRSAGMLYSKFEWHDVPDWAAEEVAANLLLEIEAEPLTVEDKATRLVVNQPGRKGRKL